MYEHSIKLLNTDKRVKPPKKKMTTNESVLIEWIAVDVSYGAQCSVNVGEKFMHMETKTFHHSVSI